MKQTDQNAPGIAPGRPPRKRRPIRWKYGTESSFKLLVFDGHRWLPPLYSHDVPNKGISKGTRAEFSDDQKIARLQNLFSRGGTRGNHFDSGHMTYAVIIPNFGKIKDAVAFWMPQSGWQPVQKATAPVLNRDWRLWMAGSKPLTFVANTECDEFRQYAANLPTDKPHLAVRYADPESGELPQSFLITAYLGEIATRLQAGQKYTRAYIYHGTAPDPVLRVDLASGRLCGIRQGGGWVSPEFFFTH